MNCLLFIVLAILIRKDLRTEIRENLRKYVQRIRHSSAAIP
jgi:hypothetical protein